MPSKALGPEGARCLQQFSVRMLSAWVEGSAIPGFKTGWPLRFCENAGRGEGGAPNAFFALPQSSMLHPSAPVCACCWRSSASSLPPGRPASARCAPAQTEASKGARARRREHGGCRSEPAS